MDLDTLAAIMTAIATWIMAIGTILLVLIALPSFRNKQKTEIEKLKEEITISKYEFKREKNWDLERDQIRELIQKIVSPFIEKLKTQLKSLQLKQYRWNNSAKRSPVVEVLTISYPEEEKLAFEEFKEKFPKFKELIETHNKMVRELTKSLKAVGDAIWNKEFQELCKELVEEWNEKPLDGRRFTLDETKYLIEYVIDGKKKIEGYTFDKFWNKNYQHLLKTREEKEIRQKIMQVDRITEELYSVTQKLYAELVILRKTLKEKYTLLVKDLIKK